ncbi:MULTISPECIES: response regulator transcription factor [unclassified Spirosoma]|uniref:response regulator transcription factor n=1 Tax=unclassified Spirosoma TaxID=2621999 RepID=UPI000958FD1C|nr:MULTISPECIES: response regulator transcription factor [unclassified Spirosoma]MBN8821507.1 response regulator transcription factor [Spirosoma sp.]OJW78286.1 MAG: DNA-binding response regulator [Spirosoma sp. 48-14]
MHILIVEDEASIAGFLRKGLEANGFHVQIASDGLMGQKMALDYPYDLIIADVNLPRQNGRDMVEILRRQKVDTPILMLSALGTSNDIITGLDVGADDYLVKPVQFDILMARVRALTRRHTGRLNSEPTLVVGDLVLNQDERTAKRGSRPINLTAKEFQLLEYLMQNQGRVVSRASIAEQVWDMQYTMSSNSIEVYVGILRKKIDQPGSPQLIHTVIGEGYVLRAP